MSAKPSSTLGYERRFNPMLAEMTVDDFVTKANADLAPKPPTMTHIVERWVSITPFGGPVVPEV